MQLIEAIEKGYARCDGWHRGNFFNLGNCHEEDGLRACAIGLAFLGTHDAGDVHAIDNWHEVNKLMSNYVHRLNDDCTSYEEMLAVLGKYGLTDLEITP